MNEANSPDRKFNFYMTIYFLSYKLPNGTFELLHAMHIIASYQPRPLQPLLPLQGLGVGGEGRGHPITELEHPP